MKVLAIQGSPRKNGNTATMLKTYIAELKNNDEQTVIDTIEVRDKEIQSCTDCQACKKADRQCIIQDDMQEIYPQILEADLIVIASPIYWWGISAQAKQFIDRWYALDYGDKFMGKKLVLMLTYSGPEPNTGIPIIKDMFDRICTYLKMDFLMTYGVRTLDTHIKDNPQAQEDIRALAHELQALL
jgi:multimeric flavodoxin WrbA